MNKNIYEFGDIEIIDEFYLLTDLIFLYLELDKMGLKYQEIKSGPLKYFKLLDNDENTINKVIKRSTFIKRILDKFTDYYFITRINQKKIVSLYGVHSFYPYKGKFNPHMIRSLINFLDLNKGSVILDPFVGSGTTGVEANYLGYNFIGYDISPLCVLMSKVKTDSIFFLDEISDIKNDVLNEYKKIKFESYDDYNNMIRNLTNNESVINFYNLVRLKTISDVSNRRRNVDNAFLANVTYMIDILDKLNKKFFSLDIKLGRSFIKEGDARKLELDDESVDAIITSPPYSITLDYIKNDLHSLEKMSIDVSAVKDNMIGVRGKKLKEKIYNYFEDMYLAFKEMVRVVRKGSYIIIVIGNFNNVDNVHYTISTMENLSTELEYNLVKKIQKDFIMKRENVLIFRKI